VEQYGVRVEIPTEAHEVSHSSTRSMYTSSWPCFESNGFLFGRRYALSMPTPCPAKLPTPSWEEQTLYRKSDMQWCGSLAGMHGCVPTWHVTGLRGDVGEPLVRPVKSSPSHCPSRRPPRSVRFGPPAARSGSSPRLQRAGRTNESLAATPSST
jgi:hypothetical protein